MERFAIQLIRPPYKTDSICPPINLMALAGQIEPHYPVCITDFVVPYIRDEMSLDAAGIRAAAEGILAQETSVLGFTSMCSSYAAALRIAQDCKRLDPRRFIVFGGPHASFVAAETLRAFDFVDAVVIGEGELAFLELLKKLKAGDPLDGLAGVAFRRDHEVFETSAGPVADELDSLPFPAFHLVANPGRYFEAGERRFMEIEVGRGCPFDCSFCSTSLFFSRRYRMKSPARVVQEMLWLKRNWDISSFGLIHDNMTSNKKKVREFCQHLLDCGESFEWHCSSRTDTIDRPLMEIMRAAGCQSIFFGVETGSAEMQRIMGKRLKIDRVQETFTNLQAVGIDATASFIIGFPEETPEMLEQTLQMALDLRLNGVRDVQLHPLSALPGTQTLAEHEALLKFYPHLLLFHDITSVIDITETERTWIADNRKIFSNFYAVQPLHYPLDLVHKIRGCYFYLMHYRPITLQCIHLVAGLSHVIVVERLCARLPASFEAWLPDTLLQALVAVIEDLGEASRLCRDVERYEDAVFGLARFSDGSNGWVHYKGQAAADMDRPATEPRLRPIALLHCSYDVPLVIKALAHTADRLPPARNLDLAIVFEVETMRIRTMEVDAVTSRFIENVLQGEGFSEVLDDVASRLPLYSGIEKAGWAGEFLHHLGPAGLGLLAQAQEDASLAQACPPAIVCAA